MDSSVAKKEKQLGMRISMAAYHLTRQILFRLVQELHRDICFRCNKEIETLGEFSIEHKKPWLDVDPALFWDLENIAFSHRKCNSGAARIVRPWKKEAPQGMAWCTDHGMFLPVAGFNINQRHWNGYQAQCRECHRTRVETVLGPRKRRVTLSSSGPGHLPLKEKIEGSNPSRVTNLTALEATS